MREIEFKELNGKILTRIEIKKREEDGDYRDGDKIIFHCEDGDKYHMYHVQDCCEDVHIEDICGDLDDLVGCRIISASDESSRGRPEEVRDDPSLTWTFYKIQSEKGGVTIRWYGASNGYYSEGVGFFEEIPN